MFIEIHLKDFLQEKSRTRFENLLIYCECHKGELYERFNKCRWFVDHGFEHAKGVLVILDRILLPKFTGNENYLNDKELFYLLCAVLLHDIGMSYGGDIKIEEYSDESIEVRKCHGVHSADLIKEKKELDPILNEYDRDIVAEIVQYHQSKAPLTDAQAKKVDKKKIVDKPIRKETSGEEHERIRLRFLAALLQLADACDINYRRAKKGVYDRQLEENEREIKKIKKNFVRIAKAVAEGGIQKKIKELEKETKPEKMLRLCTDIFVDIFVDIAKSSGGRNVEDKIEELKKETDPEEILSLCREIKQDLSTFSDRYSGLLDLMGEFLARIVILDIQKYHYPKHQSIKNVYFIGDYIVLEPYGEAGHEEIEKAREEIRKELELVEEVFNDKELIEVPPVFKNIIVLGDETWKRGELRVEDDARSIYERWKEREKKKWEEKNPKSTLRLKHLSELDRLITNPNFIETPESKGIKGRNWKEIKETVYSDFYSFKELREGEILVIHGDIGIGKTTYMLFFVENILKTSKEEAIFLDSTRIESSLVEIKYETGKFVAVDALGRGGRLKEKSEQLVDFVKNNNAKLIITMRTHEKETFEDVVREKGYEIKTIEPKPPLDVISYIVANYLLYFKVDADDLKPEEAFKVIYSGDYVRYPKLKKALEIIAEKSNVSPFYIYHTISELRRKDLQFELATIKDLPEGVEELLLNTLRKDFIFKGKERKGNKSFLKLLICLRNLGGYYSVYLYETLYEELKGEFDIRDRVEAFKAFLIVTEDGYEFKLPFYWSEAINKALSRDIKDKWLADEFIRAEAELNPKIIENVLKGEIEKREINRRYFHLLGCAARWGLLDYAYVKFKEVEGSRIEDEEYARLFISIGYYTYGLIYIKLKQYMKAIESFSREIELDPNDYIAYYDRGIAYSKLNQHERAIADLSRTIELNPNDYRGYFSRGTIYYSLNQYEGAMDDFNKAIELNPYLADAYSYRGIIYHILKQDDRALKDLNKAIKLDPNNAVKYYNCGIFYRDLKQYKLAIRKFNKAIGLDPSYAEAYYDLGNIYLESEEYRSAIKEYGKAIKLRTNYIEAYHNRGGAYLRLEEYKSAIENFNKAIELDPNDAGVYYNRGVAYSKLENYKSAIEDFNKAVELRTNFDHAYYERGNTHFKLKEYEMAVRDFDKAIELNPNYIGAYYNRGSAYIELKRHKKAIEDYNKAIELDPTLANPYNQRGLIYDRLKKYESAIEDYSKAIELSPNLASVYANRGNAYNALKQHEKAIEDFNKAVELNLNEGGVYNSRGMAFLILGQYEKAISDFKTGGILFFTSGEKEEAILTFSSTASMRLKGMPQNDDVVYCGIASLLLSKGRDITTKREDMMSKLKKMFSTFFIESSEDRMNKNIRNIMSKLKKTQIENEILRKIYELMLKKSKGEEVSEEVERLEKGTKERELRELLEMLRDF